MRQHSIVLLPGDGIGPEITAVARSLLKAVAAKYKFGLHFNEQAIGGAAISICGDPLPNTTLQACQSADAVLLASIGDPHFDTLPRMKRPESGLLALRAGMGLFANLRPIFVHPTLTEVSSLRHEIVKDVDLIIVRELISGIYFGQPRGRIDTGGDERAFNTMTYAASEIDRVAHIAFKLAEQRRGKLCSVDKANVLDVSQLWRDRIKSLAPLYPSVVTSHMYVDNAAMQLIRDPSQFDVLLTGNLFGDILSDEASMLSGSIGLLPSASLGDNGPGLFEPIHGSAPDIAGQDKANPIALVLSAAMLLRIGLEERAAADNLECAVNHVLTAGFRTRDLAVEGCTTLGCAAMGKELLSFL